MSGFVRFYEPLDQAQHLFLRQHRPLAAHDKVIETQKLAIGGRSPRTPNPLSPMTACVEGSALASGTPLIPV
jgi:hypothetical protein